MVLDFPDWAPHAQLWSNQSRIRALGPFFEKIAATNGESFLAVHPFYSRLSSPDEEYVAKEYLWPVGSFRHRLALFTDMGH
jgi:hypothetical protein